MTATEKLSDSDIATVLAWIDTIPLSKPKRNITRDFSDGVLLAEVVHFHIPKLVELFMYTPANGAIQKMENWKTLNQKVFKKIQYVPSKELISGIVNNKNGYIEQLLFQVRQKIEAYNMKNKTRESRSSSSTDRSETNENHETESIRRDSDASNVFVHELQETLHVLQLKVTKLEQLLILKDRRIDELQQVIAMRDAQKYE